MHGMWVVVACTDLNLGPGLGLVWEGGNQNFFCF